MDCLANLTRGRRSHLFPHHCSLWFLMGFAFEQRDGLLTVAALGMDLYSVELEAGARLESVGWQSLWTPMKQVSNDGMDWMDHGD